MGPKKTLIFDLTLATTFGVLGTWFTSVGIKLGFVLLGIGVLYALISLLQWELTRES